MAVSGSAALIKIALHLSGGTIKPVLQIANAPLSHAHAAPDRVLGIDYPIGQWVIERWCWQIVGRSAMSRSSSSRVAVLPDEVPVGLLSVTGLPVPGFASSCAISLYPHALKRCRAIIVMLTLLLILLAVAHRNALGSALILEIAKGIGALGILKALDDDGLGLLTGPAGLI